MPSVTVSAVAAGVGAAGSLAKGVGGLIGSGAAQQGASQQAGAIQQGVDFAQQVYGTAEQNYQPYLQGGTNALGAVSQLYGLPAVQGSQVPAGNALNAYQAYTQTPFYQFPLQQGQQTMERSAAARGAELSGGQFNALQQYGQNYASGNFDKYISGLTGLANLGTTAAAGIAQAGGSAAGNVLQGQTGIGASRAAGTVGSANQLNNALSGVAPLVQSVGTAFGGNASSNNSSFGTDNAAYQAGAFSQLPTGTYGPNQ